MKKLLSLFMCVVLLSLTLPIPTHAQTVEEADDNMQFVSTGYGFTMVIKADNTLWAWGQNSHGLLGDGTTTNRFNPIKIMDNVEQVNAGFNSVMAIKTDGSLWTWGKTI